LPAWGQPRRLSQLIQFSSLSIAFIVPFGWVTKFDRGPGQAWLNDAFGGVPYEIFWMLLIAGIWPRWRPGAIALIVFITTCLLELLPLWQPAWLPAFALPCWDGWGWAMPLPGAIFPITRLVVGSAGSGCGGLILRRGYDIA